MVSKLNSIMILKKIDDLELDLARLKRDILHGLATRKRAKKMKPTLFGSVKGGDVTEKMIEESKRNLFRNLKNI